MTLIRIRYNKLLKSLDKKTTEDYCFKCSVCTICPINNSKKYRVRKDNKEDMTFIYDIVSSPDPTANSNLWKCCSCEACIEVCPQMIEPGHIFTDIKETSFRKGLAPITVYRLLRTIVKAGIAFPVTSWTRRNRDRLGLRTLRNKTPKDLEVVVQATGLQKILKTQNRRNFDV